MLGFVVAGLVVFHSAVAFASGASWFVTDPRPSRGITVSLLWGHCGGCRCRSCSQGRAHGMRCGPALRQRPPGRGWRGCWSRSHSAWWCWFRRCSISKGSPARLSSAALTLSAQLRERSRLRPGAADTRVVDIGRHQLRPRAPSEQFEVMHLLLSHYCCRKVAGQTPTWRRSGQCLTTS